ncbi:MAG: hypothetical protein EON55_00325 [Alphaproteobacteria bacterium]|nr:MAG: hypothetical protein EON55_00325 [Alphaproteobacteria bacterium]TXN72036.1 hypothetical protein FV230_06340 [Methylobacterium sp. WL6]
MGSALAARVRYAQVVKHPISAEKLTALIFAARLLKEYNAPWPPLMKQVLNELMLHYKQPQVVKAALRRV